MSGQEPKYTLAFIEAKLSICRSAGRCEVVLFLVVIMGICYSCGFSCGCKCSAFPVESQVVYHRVLGSYNLRFLLHPDWKDKLQVKSQGHGGMIWKYNDMGSAALHWMIPSLWTQAALDKNGVIHGGGFTHLGSSAPPQLLSQFPSSKGKGEKKKMKRAHGLR